MRYRKVYGHINGIDVTEYEPIQTSFLTKIFVGVFILGLLLLVVKLSILYGAVKERKDKNCIGYSEMSVYENTLKLANTICVDIQKQQMSEIKDNYAEKVKTAEEEAKKWRFNYNNLQKQATTSTEKSNGI
jgi:hypothetical protein